MGAHAGCVMDGAQDGRRRRHQGRLADSLGARRTQRFAILDQDALDLRHVADGRDQIVVQVLGAAGAILLHQREPEALRDAAVYLAVDNQGVDGAAHVVRGVDVQQLHRAEHAGRQRPDQRSATGAKRLSGGFGSGRAEREGQSIVHGGDPAAAAGGDGAQTAAIEERTGVRLEVTRVAVRNLSAPREVQLADGVLTRDAHDVVNDPDIDIIYVSTLNHVHNEHALLAINAGKHVLVEKPFTINAEEAKQIQRAAIANKVMAIKESLIQFDGKTQKPFVEVETTSQKFVRKDLVLGVSDGIYVEIKSGIKASDKIKVWNQGLKTEESKP